MKKVTRGSGNVFADLGFKDSGEMLVRARLTHRIYTLLKEKKLTQKEAAQRLGLKQPDVSALMNGKFLDFSVDRLLSLLVRLNQDVEIVIRPAPRGKDSAGVQISAM